MLITCSSSFVVDFGPRNHNALTDITHCSDNSIHDFEEVNIGRAVSK